MTFALGAIPVSMAGSIAGAKAAQLGGKLIGGGGGGSSGPNIGAGISQANNILKKSLNQALGYSENYTNQGIGTQKQYLGTATDDLTTYLQNAVTAAQQQTAQGLAMSQATNAPMVQTGYNALDRYEDSLGLARPSMGNAAYAQSLQQAAALNPQIQALQQAFQGYNQAASAPGASTQGFTNADWQGENKVGAYTAPTLTQNAFDPNNISSYAASGNINKGPTAAELIASQESKPSQGLLDYIKNHTGQVSHFNFQNQEPNNNLGTPGLNNSKANLFPNGYFIPGLQKMNIPGRTRGNIPGSLLREWGYNLGENVYTGAGQEYLYGTVPGHPNRAWNGSAIPQNIINAATQAAVGSASNPGSLAGMQQTAVQQGQQAYQALGQQFNPYQQQYQQLQQQLNNINPYAVATGIAANQGLFGPTQIV